MWRCRFDAMREAGTAKNFYREALARLAALPGVEAVGSSKYAAAQHQRFRRKTFLIEGQPSPAPGAQPNSDFRIINPDYFRALGMRSNVAAGSLRRTIDKRNR